MKQVNRRLICFTKNIRRVKRMQKIMLVVTNSEIHNNITITGDNRYSMFPSIRPLQFTNETAWMRARGDSIYKKGRDARREF